MSLKEDIARYVMQKYVLKRLKEESDLLGADIRDGMAELYERGGVTQMRADLGGTKVGTVSARVSQPTKALKVVDSEAYRSWCEENGFILTKTDDKAVQELFESEGVVPDGCDVAEVRGGFVGITCRPDRKKLDEMMATGALPGTVELLEG